VHDVAKAAVTLLSLGTLFSRPSSVRGGRLNQAKLTGEYVDPAKYSPYLDRTPDGQGYVTTSKWVFRGGKANVPSYGEQFVRWVNSKIPTIDTAKKVLFNQGKVRPSGPAMKLKPVESLPDAISVAGKVNLTGTSPKSTSGSKVTKSLMGALVAGSGYQIYRAEQSGMFEKGMDLPIKVEVTPEVNVVPTVMPSPIKTVSTVNKLTNAYGDLDEIADAVDTISPLAGGLNWMDSLPPNTLIDKFWPDEEEPGSEDNPRIPVQGGFDTTIKIPPLKPGGGGHGPVPVEEAPSHCPLQIEEAIRKYGENAAEHITPECMSMYLAKIKGG
jgi:hypothetical protein